MSILKDPAEHRDMIAAMAVVTVASIVQIGCMAVIFVAMVTS